MDEEKIRLQLSSIGGALINKGYLGNFPESVDGFVEEVVNDCYSFFFPVCFISSARVRYSSHFDLHGDLFWYKLQLLFTDNVSVEICSMEISWKGKKHYFEISGEISLLPLRFVALIWQLLVGPKLLPPPKSHMHEP